MVELRPRTWGSSVLLGRNPRSLLRTSDGDWATTDGGTPTTHILKPVAGDYRRIDIVEHMTMRAAEMMGLSVASTSLDSFDGVRTFVATRYDREYVDGCGADCIRKISDNRWLCLQPRSTSAWTVDQA
ncbi:HipA domain-containing protein [Gordonia sp. DT101]|uniref:HipA domain-containing protein n=1 Tax=Gordonia sp. DT101 TaxID=3416545 RepID=UPI003CF092A8